MSEGKPNAFTVAEREAKERLKNEQREVEKKDSVIQVLSKVRVEEKIFVSPEGEQIRKPIHKPEQRSIILSFRQAQFDKVMGQTTYETFAVTEILPFYSDRCKSSMRGFSNEEVKKAVQDIIKSQKGYGGESYVSIQVKPLSKEDLAVRDELENNRDVAMQVAQRRREVEASLEKVGIPSFDTSGLPPLPTTLGGGNIPFELQGLETEMV